MKNIITAQNHPDFVGGWVWTKLEMEWIENRIAKAVAAEREACAKACEELRPTMYRNDTEASIWEIATLECTDEIRLRGNI